MKKKLLVIGNGMVTGRLLDELGKQPRCPWDITVLSEEEYGNYNRILLSSYLAGAADLNAIIQKSPEWFKENQIALFEGDAVVSVDAINRNVATSKGLEIDYDHLVFATGSRASKIPTATSHCDGVYYFRSVNDAKNILSAAKNSTSAVVVGGGFLGLEAAWGLMQSGLEVSIVHRNANILNRQLDSGASAMLERFLKDAGASFYTGAQVSEIKQLELQKCVSLNTGVELTADIIVIATGITPNSELAKSAGVEVNRGIVVNEYMQTSDEHISALGECAEFDGSTFGLVDPLWEQAEVLAERLCSAVSDSELTAYELKNFPTKLKISGLATFSVGQTSKHASELEYIIEDQANNVYRKLIVDDGLIKGIVLLGDVKSAQFYYDLMAAQKNIKNYLPDILCGEEFVTS